MNQHKSAWAEIHQDDLEHNLRVVRAAVKKPVSVCGVVKADAYGHGLAGISRCLSAKKLVDMIAVGKMSELIQLSNEDLQGSTQILLLGAANADEIEDGIREGRIDASRCIFSIYNMRQFEEMERLAETISIRIKVHIRIDGWDTGMGLSFKDFLFEEERLFASPHFEICGLYSHLYTSYSEDLELIHKELEEFDTFVSKIRPEHRSQLKVHILNSVLVFRFPEYAYDMVRVGTALYGLPCEDGNRLRPVMRIYARVFEVCEVDPDAPLSYQPAVTTERRRRIARIMLGYWDVPLLLTQTDLRIRIRDRLFALADAICMDNLCIDVTGDEEILPGDVAVLLGEEGVTIKELLARHGIHYVHGEWLCMTAGRLEKIYV